MTEDGPGAAGSAFPTEEGPMKRLARPVILFLLVVLAAAATASAEMPAEADAIATHLEFYGYTRGDEEGWLTFSHDEKLSFTMQSYQGGILMQSWFGGTAYSAEHPDEFHSVVNSMNAAATVMRLYVDDDGDLAMEAWYPGAYSKEIFTSFLEAWIEDGEMLLGSHYEALSKLVE
jgi:hypothetical protein